MTTRAILLCGQSRAGKTSVANVVFKKMSPHETLFLESTQKLETRMLQNQVVPFELWDFPGGFDFDTLTNEHLFTKAGAIVFVIDAQLDDFREAVESAVKLIVRSYKFRKGIGYDVFIHKIDGDNFINDEHKVEVRRDISNMLDRELREANVEAKVSYHRTSIYDYSVFEAFSKLVQRLIPHLGLIEQLLDQLISACKMEKAYLFDLVSKIYFASDSQPMDDSYELCTDMLDVCVDTSVIYGQQDSIQDIRSSCSIALNNNLVLYLRGVEKQLALACLVREDAFDKQHLVDYNIGLFRDALQQVFLKRT